MEKITDGLTTGLHGISSALLIPTIIILVLLVVYALWCLGSFIVEAVGERRRYRAYLPEFVAALDAAHPADVPRVIEDSQLLRAQKDDLLELNTYLYLPHDARIEVAKRLMATQESRLMGTVSRGEAAAKVAPMLGLMGTLIPLGPGIVALSSGDLDTLSQSLLVAFDTTVAGLATAVVCFLVSRVRRRWYEDHLVSLEAAFNTLLEKAETLQSAGYDFPRASYVYDKHGVTAQRVVVPSRDDAAQRVVAVPRDEVAPRTAVAPRTTAIPCDGAAQRVAAENASRHGRHTRGGE